jgi:hypothetical protein
LQRTRSIAVAQYRAAAAIVSGYRCVVHPTQDALRSHSIGQQGVVVQHSAMRAIATAFRGSSHCAWQAGDNHSCCDWWCTADSIALHAQQVIAYIKECACAAPVCTGGSAVAAAGA